MARPLIEVKVDWAQMRNVQRMLQGIPREIPSVISKGINHTIAPIRTSMARQLVKPVNAEMTAVRKAHRKAKRHIIGYYKKAPSTRFKIADIKKNIRFQRATRKVWQALIWIKRFKGQESQTSTETAFVAQMKSGHISIFKRLGAARIPIADQLRRLMRQFFTGISSQLRRETAVRLERNIEFYMKQALDKWRTGAGKAA